MTRVDTVDRFASTRLHTATAVAASGNGSEVSGFGRFSRLRAQLSVTALTGTTPTLDVVIEDTLDGTNWATVATFTQKTAAGSQTVDATGVFSDRLRVRWTVGGTTPAATFTVDVVAK